MCPPCPLPGKAFRFWLHHPRLFASSVRDGGGRRGGHRLHHLNVCLVQSMIAGPIQKMDDESFQNDQAEAQSKQLSWCVFSTLKNTFHSLSMNCQNVIAGDGHNRGAITPYKWNLLVKLLFYPHSMFFPVNHFVEKPSFVCISIQKFLIWCAGCGASLAGFCRSGAIFVMLPEKRII